MAPIQLQKLIILGEDKNEWEFEKVEDAVLATLPQVNQYFEFAFMKVSGTQLSTLLHISSHLKEVKINECKVSGGEFNLGSPAYSIQTLTL